MTRWFLVRKQKYSADAVAAMHNVDPITIQSSIDYVEEYRAQTSDDLVLMKVNEVAMDLLDEGKLVISEAMKARRVIGTYKNGKPKYEPDTALRLRAQDRVTELIRITRPTGPAFQQNLQINNGQGAPHLAPEGMSFEARLRRIREKKGMANDAEVIEGTMEENEEQTVEDELSDIGIDLEEDEEAEEE